MMIVIVQLLLFLLYSIVQATITNFCGLNCVQNERVKRHFYIYWNVPTVMCHKYGINFAEVNKYNIAHNTNDTFHGNVISILYDPGEFPAMIQVEDRNERSKDKRKSPKVVEKYKKRNGGLPQLGNFDKHKSKFVDDLREQVPRADFSGIGVIDFERWRPVFRQNWGNTKIHKDMSIELVRKAHPLWALPTVESEAKRKFEKYARYFMEETLKLAKKHRFKGDWGYYGYPYCFNLSSGHPGTDCDPKVMDDNDKMSWLFNNQEVLLPSVYLKYFTNPLERVGLVKGRVQEAIRISNNLKHKPRVIPYWWYKYTDQTDVFLSEADVKSTFKEILENKGDGIIIWGSSSDVDSESKCKRLRRYLEVVLGPISASLLKIANEGDFAHL